MAGDINSLNLLVKTVVMLTVLCTTLFSSFYPFNLQDFSGNHLVSIRVENSVDSGQMASLHG